MKEIIKNLITSRLRFLTKYYLKLKKIEVIAITGSAGKTTTKVALAQFLKDDSVYVPKDGYNTEIGVPLAIFQEHAPNNVTNFMAWAGILIRSHLKLFKAAPYKVIVLEMGADKPGDIEYLTSFIKPKIAIITAVLSAHVEEFKNIEAIAYEKGVLVEALPKDGVAILNSDNKYVRQMAQRTDGKVIYVGQDPHSHVRFENIKVKKTGLIFNLIFKGQEYRIKTKIIAPQLLQSLISAFAAASQLDFETSDLIRALENFEPENGRMKIIEGIKGTTLIDDSYNANPDSVMAALEVLEQMPGRKIAVLGSMNELGAIEKESHLKVGKKAAEVAEIVLTVGEAANKYVAAEVRKKKKEVYTFENSKVAGEFLKNKLEREDIILFKGSQNQVLVEEAVKAVMKHPEEAVNLLVRQSKMWEDKKAEYFKEEK